MDRIINNILTDGNARSTASVEQHIISRVQLAAAWMSVQQY